VKVIIAGYTAAPADPHDRLAYYEKLRALPGADGLEFGWTPATDADLGGALDLLPPDWSVTLNDITATFQASVANPRSGLASPDPAGRTAAVAMAAGLAAFVRTVNDRLGRRAVLAVEVHSAPGFAQRVLQPDAAAFSQSLAELAGMNWDGAEVLVEHCDAFVPGQLPAKGFLDLDAEIAALASADDSALRLSLNWGRSAIEFRGYERVAEHIDAALASGLLRAITFSGAAATPTSYGAAWADSHLPFADTDDPAYADQTSLMTRDRVSEALARLETWEGSFAAVKTNWPPGQTDPAERAASVAANFETLAGLIKER
jgi:Domain of unknown function (DUF4862)